MMQDAVDFRSHFQHGLWGLPHPSDLTAGACQLVKTDEEQGPIELLFVDYSHVPKFEDATSAYEAGRCLRMIGYILDRIDTEPAAPRRLLQRLTEKNVDSDGAARSCFWTSKSVCLVAKEAVGLPEKDYLAFERSALGYSKSRPDAVLFEVPR